MEAREDTSSWASLGTQEGLCIFKGGEPDIRVGSLNCSGSSDICYWTSWGSVAAHSSPAVTLALEVSFRWSGGHGVVSQASWEVGSSPKSVASSARVRDIQVYCQQPQVVRLPECHQPWGAWGAPCTFGNPVPHCTAPQKVSLTSQHSAAEPWLALRFLPTRSPWSPLSHRSQGGVGSLIELTHGC